jgi:hypothetical protein
VQIRHTITNDTTEPQVVFTEPEGQDFWLLPGESLEVVAEAAAEGDKFEIDRLPNGHQVWPAAKMGYISAWVGENQLSCGHQRPAIEPIRQFQFHEYHALLDDKMTTAEPSVELARAALGQAEVLWPELQIGEWSQRKQMVETVAICSNGLQLVHVRANRKNCYLILVVPPQQLQAIGYLLFDIGAEYGDIQFTCPEFNIERKASKADIYQFIPRLPGKRNPTAILQRGLGTYMQAFAEGDLFIVEHQLVSVAAHYELQERVDASTVIQLFLSYAFGKNEWAHEYVWNKMTL